MGFAVFIHRADSIYEDSPAEQYQFPRQYLSRAKTCVGDWIVYYEPRKVAETKGYFAIAKVQQIIPDPKAAGMYLALIEPGSYLDLANPVPFSGSDGVVERGVLNADGRIRGALKPRSVHYPMKTSTGLYNSALLRSRRYCHEWTLPKLDFSKARHPSKLSKSANEFQH